MIAIQCAESLDFYQKPVSVFVFLHRNTVLWGSKWGVSEKLDIFLVNLPPDDELAHFNLNSHPKQREIIDLWMMVQRERKTPLCACVLYLCLESKRIIVSPQAPFFPQLWCQGLIAVSIINLNALFVVLNLQINPSSCITYTSQTHTHTYVEAQLGRDVTCLPKSFFLFLEVLWTTSQCASALPLSSHTRFFPWSFYEHLLMQSFLLHLGLLLFHYAWWRD